MIDEVGSDADRRMAKSVEMLVREISGLRTGRASTALVDNIPVECHGAQMTINQVATVTVKDATTLALNVWDESVVPTVEKAIIESDIGMTPMVNGGVIHLNVPPLTEERRGEMVKLAGKYAETARVSVRNIRRDANHALKEGLKGGELTEDEHRKGEERINALTQKRIDEVDELLLRKEKEIMST